MKRKGKILTAAITTAALVGASYGGVTYWQANNRPEFAVFPVSELSTRYWGDEIQLEGNITSGAIQTFYVRPGDVVTSVLVQEGEQVKKGDVLMVMDSTAQTLQLDTDLLTLEQMKLKITQAERALEKLKKTTPISENNGGWDDFGGWDDWGDIEIPEPEPEEPEEPEEIHAILYSDLNPLDFEAEPYAGDGTEENPYHFLCTNGTLIRGSFLNKMAGYSTPDGSGEKESKGSYFCLEVRSGNSASGTLETAWIQDASILPMAVNPEWTAELQLHVQEKDPDQKEEEENQKPDQGGSETGGSGEGGSSESGSGEGGSSEGGSGESGSGEGESSESGSGEGGSSESGSGESGSGEGGSDEGGSGAGGSQESGEGEDNTEPVTTSSEEGLIGTSSYGRTPSAAQIVWNGESLAALLTSLGSYDSDGYMEYTAEELKKAIAAKENEIKILKLDLKAQELQVEKQQNELQDSYVKAEMDGVIQKISDPETPPNDGSAFLELIGTAGTYLRGYISELQLDQIQVGDMVNVTSWMNGAVGEAEITDISRFPEENAYYGNYGAAASYYPFSAVISGGGFMEGDWVQIQMASSEMQDSALYLEKAFIRDDNGSKYVYLMDENGLLKKQPVRTGKILWGSYYEIRSGLTQEDYVAFPYGKKIGEGAATRIAPLSELYNY